MSIEQELAARSGNACELCTTTDNLGIYEVPPAQNKGVAGYTHICTNCQGQIDKTTEIEANHWRCLNDSMWSPTPAVQVLAWRMLNRLKGEGWTQDLLDMMYMEENTLKWAKAMGDEDDDEEETIIHKDAHGAILEAGDNVTLIQDLNVKGAGFTAKRGTAVRRIALVPDNAEHIEGKVEGQHIVILTKYVKKLPKVER